MGSVASPLWSHSRSCATLRARHLDGGGSWVIELSGEADIATMALLRQELAHMAARQPAGVVVDVTGLEFCDVASAELIQGARRTRAVTVIGATGTVKRLFDLMDRLQAQQLPHYLASGHPQGRPMVRTRLAV